MKKGCCEASVGEAIVARGENDDGEDGDDGRDGEEEEGQSRNARGQRPGRFAPLGSQPASADQPDLARSRSPSAIVFHSVPLAATVRNSWSSYRLCAFTSLVYPRFR